MDINEALRARRDGATVDDVLAGLLEGHSVKPTVHDHFRRFMEADEEAGTGEGKLTKSLLDPLDKISKEEGPEVAAAALVAATKKAGADLETPLGQLGLGGGGGSGWLAQNAGSAH